MAFHVIQVIFFNIAIKIRTDWGQVQTQCFGEPPLVTKPVQRISLFRAKTEMH